MKKGIVSTGSKDATNAAIGILEVGGNAFDAAVAAVFTSMTSEFALTGAGGGGAMMISAKGKDPILYDFFVDTPPNKNKELDFFGVDVDFGDSTQTFHIGKGSAAVPGTLLGLLTIQEHYGRLPLPVILEPAINAAEQGIILNSKQAYIFQLLDPIFSYTNAGKDLFHLNGNILCEGDRFRNSDFATFLEQVSKEGSSFFYFGDGAALIEKYFKDGGLLSREALKIYHVAVRKPVKTKFLNHIVYSNPAPSVGGTLIIFLLRLVEESGIKNIKISDLLLAISITNIARKEICKDPNDEYQINQLLDDKVFQVYLKKFSSKNRIIEKNQPNPSKGSTTHVSVIDKDLNAASVTTTNGEGCGYILPGTGIMMNNMLGEQDLNPLGFHKWTHPMRLPTMISPSIIMKHKKPYLLIGSGGSNRIRSAIVQVILNYIKCGYNIKDSISAPRIHLEGNKVFYEPGIDISSGEIAEEMLLHGFEEKNLFFGGVNAVTLNDGYSDPRRSGTFKII